jgi:hypothetical protein
LPAVTPTPPAPADWQQQKPDAVASPPLARAAAAGTSVQNQAATEVAPSVVVPPASPNKSHFKKEAASVAPPKLIRKADRSPEDDDLLMCELEQELDARKKPSTKMRRSQRRASPSLLAALALLLIGAGFYAGWMMKPGFRAAVLRDYEKLRQLITRTGTSPQTTTSAPSVPQPVAPKAVATAKSGKTNSKTQPAASAPARGSVAEGFLSSQETSAPGSQGKDTASNSGKSVLLRPRRPPKPTAIADPW